MFRAQLIVWFSKAEITGESKPRTWGIYPGGAKANEVPDFHAQVTFWASGSTPEAACRNVERILNDKDNHWIRKLPCRTTDVCRRAGIRFTS